MLELYKPCSKPEMFMIELTNSLLILAVMASIGGCAVRYASLFVNDAIERLRLRYFIIDCLCAAFLGFFVFWFNIEELEMHTAKAMLINCLVGYFGAKGLDLASYVIYKKLGINFKYEPGKKETHLSLIHI